MSELNLDTLVVNSHEKLLKHINQSNCSTLINLDFHSDLSNDCVDLEYNEGTWANFVKWQLTGNFLWLYPNHYQCIVNQDGLCNSEDFDPFIDKVCGWKTVERKHGYVDLFDNNLLNNVKFIGITTSYSWLTREQFKASYLRKLIKCGKNQSIEDRIYKNFSHKIKLKDIF